MVSNALGWSPQVHGQGTTILLDLLQGLLGDLFADAAAGATPMLPEEPCVTSGGFLGTLMSLGHTQG